MSTNGHEQRSDTRLKRYLDVMLGVGEEQINIWGILEKDIFVKIHKITANDQKKKNLYRTFILILSLVFECQPPLEIESSISRSAYFFATNDKKGR